MGAPVASRIRLAAASTLGALLALTAFVAAPSSEAHSGEAAPVELLPDLVTRPITDLRVRKKGRKRLLRLTNEIGNRGDGPLEVGSAPPTGECEEGQYDAVQRVYRDTDLNGRFDRGIDEHGRPRRFGCIEFHEAPGHRHWHVVDFARYQLIRQRDGRTVAKRKVGFCILDSRSFLRSPLPGTPPAPYYGGSGCGRPGVPPEEEGLSVGWSDVYTYRIAGQGLRVTGLGRGRYCLASTADPLNLIAEPRPHNNTRTALLRLRPRKGVVKRLKGTCRSPSPVE